MDAELNDKLPERIEGALRALDRDAGTRAEAVDAARVAERVLQRLRDEPARELHPARVSLRGLRVAAALAVLVIGGVVAQRLVFGPRASFAAHALPVLPPSAPGGGAAPDASQQEAMLAAVDEARSSVGDSLAVSGSITVDDLNVQELQALLSSMDDRGGTE